MNALLDVAGDDEDNPLSGLLALVAELVSRYEQEHHAIEAANPKDALRCKRFKPFASCSRYFQ
jgi:HTH-type transcriptional regulator / antitoxin HigA